MWLSSFIDRWKSRHKDKLMLNTINEMGLGQDVWRCMVKGSFVKKWFPAEIIGSYGIDGFDFWVIIEYPNREKQTVSRSRWHIKNVHKVKK